MNYKQLISIKNNKSKKGPFYFLDNKIKLEGCISTYRLPYPKVIEELKYQDSQIEVTKWDEEDIQLAKEDKGVASDFIKTYTHWRDRIKINNKPQYSGFVTTIKENGD